MRKGRRFRRGGGLRRRTRTRRTYYAKRGGIRL